MMLILQPAGMLGDDGRTIAIDADPNHRGNSRRWIRQAVDDSLRRLGTDRIDLYQVHEWDGLTPLEETLGALQYLVDTDKVRYVGVSNYAAWQLMKTLGVAERDHLPRFVSQQIYYSLQERSAEYEIVPSALVTLAPVGARPTANPPISCPRSAWWPRATPSSHHRSPGG